jgi:hypothetical protein
MFSDERDFAEERAVMEAYRAEYLPEIQEDCLHEWTAGMMIVHDEDVAAVAALRPVECSKCELAYR